jgi:transposase
MKTNADNLTTASTASAHAAWIGLDWGDKGHAFSLVADGSGQVEQGKLLNTAEALHAWLKELQDRFEGQPIALAIEDGRRSMLHVLAQYHWMEIYPVNPVTSARYRQAFTVSGAKDDQPDSAVLLELVRLHRDKLTRWQVPEESMQLLESLVRMRRDWVDRRSQCANQLIHLLKGYFPQALSLIGTDVDSDMALNFLSRWPDLLELKRARRSTVEGFYRKHNVRRQEVIDQRLELINKAVALTTDSGLLHASSLQLGLLIKLLKTFNAHIVFLDKEIATNFKKHEDAHLFRDLPGAGAVLAPRLLAGFGCDRTRYESAASMQKYVGVAPVREKSGNQLYTHWRWQSPAFLRQSFVEWAGQTVVWSSWASHYYERMKSKGKSHHVILRALAFKWIRVLWKCWKTRVPYSEDTYLASLQKRRSPNHPLSKPA